MLVKNIKPSASGKKKGTKKKPVAKKQQTSLGIQLDEQDDFEQQMLKEIEQENLRKQQQEKANKQKQKNTSKQQTLKPLEINDMDQFEKEIKQKEEEVKMKEMEKEKKHEQRQKQVEIGEGDERLKKLQEQLLEKQRLQLQEKEKQVPIEIQDQEFKQEKLEQKEEIIAQQPPIQPLEEVKDIIEPPHEPQYVQTEIDFVEEVTQPTQQLVLVEEQFPSTDPIELKEEKIVIEESGIENLASEQVDRFEEKKLQEAEVQQVKQSQEVLHGLTSLQSVNRSVSQQQTLQQVQQQIGLEQKTQSQQISILEVKIPLQDGYIQFQQPIIDELPSNNQQPHAAQVQICATQTVQVVEVSIGKQEVQIDEKREQEKVSSDEKYQVLIVEKVEEQQAEQVIVDLIQEVKTLVNNVDDTSQFQVIETGQVNQIILNDQENNSPLVQQLVQLQQQPINIQEPTTQIKDATQTQNEYPDQLPSQNQELLFQPQFVVEHSNTIEIESLSIQPQHKLREVPVYEPINEHQSQKESNLIILSTPVENIVQNQTPAEQQVINQIHQEQNKEEIPKNEPKQQPLIAFVSQSPSIESQALQQQQVQNQKPSLLSIPSVVKKLAPKGKTTKKGKPSTKPKPKSNIQLFPSNLLDQEQQESNPLPKIKQQKESVKPSQPEIKHETDQLLKVEEIPAQIMVNENEKQEKIEAYETIPQVCLSQKDETILKENKKEYQNSKAILQEPNEKTHKQEVLQVAQSAQQVKKQDPKQEQIEEIYMPGNFNISKPKPLTSKKSTKKSSKPNTKKQTTTKKSTNTVKQSLILSNEQTNSFFTEQMVENQPQKVIDQQVKQQDNSPINSSASGQAPIFHDAIEQSFNDERRENELEKIGQGIEIGQKSQILNIEHKQQDQKHQLYTELIPTEQPIVSPLQQAVPQLVQQPKKQNQPFKYEQDNTIFNTQISLNSNNSKKKPFSSSTAKKSTNSSAKTKSTKTKTSKTAQSLIFSAGQSMIEQEFEGNFEVEQQTKVVKQQIPGISQKTEENSPKDNEPNKIKDVQEELSSQVNSKKNRLNQVQSELKQQKLYQLKPQPQAQAEKYRQPIAPVNSDKKESAEPEKKVDQDIQLKEAQKLEQSPQTPKEQSADIIDLDIHTKISKPITKPTSKKTTKKPTNSTTTKKPITSASSKVSAKATNLSKIMMDIESMMDTQTFEESNVVEVQEINANVDISSKSNQSQTYKESLQKIKQEPKSIVEDVYLEDKPVANQINQHILVEQPKQVSSSIIQKQNKSQVEQITIQLPKTIPQIEQPPIQPQTSQLTEQDTIIAESPSFIPMLQVNKKKKKKPITTKATSSKTALKKTTANSDIFFLQQQKQLIETQLKEGTPQAVHKKEETIETVVAQPVTIQSVQQTMIKEVTDQKSPSVLIQEIKSPEQLLIEAGTSLLEQPPSKQPQIVPPPVTQEVIAKIEIPVSKSQQQQITKEQMFDFKPTLSKPTKKTQKSSKNTTSTTNKAKTTKVSKSIMMNVNIETSKIEIDDKVQVENAQLSVTKQSHLLKIVQQQSNPAVPKELAKENSHQVAGSKHQRQEQIEISSEYVRPCEAIQHHDYPHTPQINNPTLQTHPSSNIQPSPALTPAVTSMIESILKTQLDLVKLNNDSNLQLIRQKVNMIRQTLNDKLKRKQERAQELKRLQEQQARLNQARAEGEEEQNDQNQSQDQGQNHVFKENIQLKKNISKQSAN